jgi:hypothetical protein
MNLRIRTKMNKPFERQLNLFGDDMTPEHTDDTSNTSTPRRSNIHAHPFRIVTISYDQAARVIATQEGQFSDVKAIEIAPGKLTKTASAFANADGGDLFIGVNEDTRSKAREWNGFQDPENANGHIQAFAKAPNTESQRKEMPKEIVDRLSTVCGRTYDGAALALSNVDDNRWVPVASFRGLQYSGFHHGAGELALMEVLNTPMPKPINPTLSERLRILSSSLSNVGGVIKALAFSVRQPLLLANTVCAVR